MEKVSIEIDGVKKIEGKIVTVVLANNNKDLRLPISQTERFGRRVFIPAWLAKKVLKEKT